MNAQSILANAYLSLRPFDGRGRLINAADAYASKVLASVSGRINSEGFSAHPGSVDALFHYLDGEQTK